MPRRLLPLLAILPLVLHPAPASAAAGPLAEVAARDTIQPNNFDVEQIAEGVYAVIRREPPGLWFDANNVFIVDDEGVIVVDSNVSPSSTREVLAALRRITDRPVTHVVNTHWHEDHILGNQVWRDAYPDVEFVGHTTSREDMLGVLLPPIALALVGVLIWRRARRRTVTAAAS